MAWTPSIAVLSVIYLLRRAVANLAAPLTSSLMMKTIRDEKKGTASGVTMTSQRLGSTFATWLGSWLITSYSINTPIYVGAVIYFAYAIAMHSLFGGTFVVMQDASHLMALELHTDD